MAQILIAAFHEISQEFVPVARELEGNWTRFTPHYIVWVCPESYRASDECQSQCIHNGRYCTPDPDGDLLAGYSGKDIVQVWDRGCLTSVVHIEKKHSNQVLE